jgi:hypothetical protein
VEPRKEEKKRRRRIIIYIDAKFHIPSDKGSLVIAIKQS